MKPVQLTAALFALILAIGLIAWGVKTIPYQLAVRDYNSKVETLRNEDAAKVQKGETPEYYRVNPFEPLPKSGPQPRAEIEKTAYEHGEMVLGTTGKHAFTVKNTGNAPLKIAKGPMECKCTIPALARDELPPGESTELIVEFTPTNEGQFIRHNDFWTNDPDHMLIRLAVQADVVGAMVIVPPTGWNIGTQDADKDVKIEGSLYSMKSELFKILSVETSSPALTFTHEAHEITTPGAPQVTKGYRFFGTLHTKKESGIFGETVTIKTDFPGRETITLPVYGTVKGPLLIFGSQFEPRDYRINLGDVRTDREHRVRLNLHVKPGSEEWMLTEVKSVPEFLKLELKRQGKVGNMDRYTLEVIVPANAPEGVWEGAASGELLVRTNYPDLAELRFKLSLRTIKGN